MNKPPEVIYPQNPYICAMLQNSWIKYEFDSSIEFIKANLTWKEEEEETILDYGCGSGKLILDYWWPFTMSKKAKIIGLDISQEMVEYGRSIFPPFLNQNVEFVSMIELRMVTPTCIPDGSIDKIFCSFVLAYYPTHRLKQVFEFMYKKLKPKGQIAIILSFSRADIIEKHPIQLFSMCKWANPDSVVQNGFGVAEWAHTFPSTDQEALNLIRVPLNSAKLSVVGVHTRDFYKIFRDLHYLQDFLQVTASSNCLVPDLLKNEMTVDKLFIQQQCTNAYDGHDPKAPIRIDWKHFTVLAEKKPRR